MLPQSQDAIRTSWKRAVIMLMYGLLVMGRTISSLSYAQLYALALSVRHSIVSAGFSSSFFSALTKLIGYLPHFAALRRYARMPAIV